MTQAGMVFAVTGPLTAVLLGVQVAAWASRRRADARLRMSMREADERHRAQASAFRRPASMGPLWRPRPELDRIRAAILVDQLAAPSSGPVEVSWPAAPGRVVPGAAMGATVRLLPYEPPPGAEDARQRALFWLGHWDDSVRALTESVAA